MRLPYGLHLCSSVGLKYGGCPTSGLLARPDHAMQTCLVLEDDGKYSDGQLAGEYDEEKGEVRAQQALALLDGAAAAEEADEQHQQAGADERVGQVLRERVALVRPEQPEQRRPVLVDQQERAQPDERQARQLRAVAERGSTQGRQWHWLARKIYSLMYTHQMPQ